MRPTDTDTMITGTAMATVIPMRLKSRKQRKAVVPNAVVVSLTSTKNT